MGGDFPLIGPRPYRADPPYLPPSVSCRRAPDSRPPTPSPSTPLPTSAARRRGHARSIRPSGGSIVVTTASGGIAVYAYPNPASRQATFVFALPQGATDAVLRILDLIGMLVREIDLAAGATQYTWDLEDAGGTVVANGMYFVVVTATDGDGRAIRSEVFRLLIAR